MKGYVSTEILLILLAALALFPALLNGVTSFTFSSTTEEVNALLTRETLGRIKLLAQEAVVSGPTGDEILFPDGTLTLDGNRMELNVGGTVYSEKVPLQLENNNIYVSGSKRVVAEVVNGKVRIWVG